MPKLVLGTHNPKKRLELAQLLQPLNIDVLTLGDFVEAIEVEETGHSFAENAALKAQHQARHLRQWVLGEDSGLVVDALDGRPGIYSARFAGLDATDEDNNRKLLQEMTAVPDARRTAHYVCHMVLADPQGRVRAWCEQICRGRIRHQPAGSNGFGYDPLFEIPEYHRTFGELGPAVKGVLSHRGRAMRRLRQQLAGLHWND